MVLETEVAEYRRRMGASRQFSFFGLRPEWRPGQHDVDGFIHDEVVRQMHDPRVKDDGGRRVQWMQAAWDYARANADRTPDLQDVLKVGALMEPGINGPYFFRSVNVWIGGRGGAPPALLNRFMSVLCGRIGDVEPDPEARFVTRRSGVRGPVVLFGGWTHETFESFVPLLETAGDWYLAFQWVHPFQDGNGRTGKTLHNWLCGTLDDPVLVPDYFGGGNP